MPHENDRDNAMSDSMTSRISYYHAHLYYTDEQGLAAARELAGQAERQFPLRVGRFHEKQVGPHPLWSCQLSFAPEEFGRIVPWLALNRGSLDIFVHVGPPARRPGAPPAPDTGGAPQARCPRPHQQAPAQPGRPLAIPAARRHSRTASPASSGW